jgi:hypothetical protein
VTAPTFTQGTEDTYDTLAGYLRNGDRQQGGYPLKRFMSGILDQFGAVLNLRDRIDYLSPDEVGADSSPLVLYTNVAANPSFESPSPLPTSLTNATSARVPAVAGSTDGGAWALEFTANAAGAFGGRLSQGPFPVTASTFSVSADIVAVTGRAVTFIVTCLDSTGATLGTVTTLAVYTGNELETQRLAGTVPLINGTVSVRIDANVNAAGAGEQFLVDCVLLTEGSSLYPYRTYAGVAAGETSELVTPETAEDTWLPWLAQLVGVTLNPALTRAAKVDAIRFASAGWQGGTKAAVAAAARSVLTGTKYVQVFDHSTSAGVGTGGEWDVLLITRGSETPDPTAVLTAVVTQKAKPAGVTLWHLSYAATWAQIESVYPTWAAWAAAGSWQRVEEAGL